MAQKNTNVLYSHPFSKAYWKDAASELGKTRVLIFAAIMIALRVVLKSLSIPIGLDLRINVAFFINAYCSMIVGPVVAGIGAAISDTLGCIFFPTGVYFFPFIFIEIAGSVIFALFLYRAKISTTRVILSRFCIDFFVNIVLQTPVMFFYYKIVLGKYYALVDLPRIVKNLAAFPIESLLLILFLRATMPPAKKLGYLYSDTEKLTLNRKNIVTLAILLVIGVMSVAGYSIYSYNTTSVSASWSSEERLATNTNMRDRLLEEYPDLGTGENTVAVVESAMRKFGNPDITYDIAVYRVADDAQTGLDTLNGYSKTKAKNSADLEAIGRAVIVVNRKTDEAGTIEYSPSDAG